MCVLRGRRMSNKMYRSQHNEIISTCLFNVFSCMYGNVFIHLFSNFNNKIKTFY